MIPARYLLRGARYIAVIDLFVFADESGISGTQPYCVVGGFMASERQWGKFEKDWAATLGRFDVPEFHSKVFFGRDQSGRRLGPFRGWSDARASAFLAELTRAITAYRITPLGSGIHVGDFMALTPGERRFLTGGLFRNGRFVTSGAPSKPYFLGMMALWGDATQFARAGKRIHFVMDMQKEFEPRAVQTAAETRFFGINEKNTHQLGEVVFASRQHWHALQAADLQCYLWYNYLVRPDSLSPERVAGLHAITGKRNHILALRTEGLEMILAKLPPEVRAALDGKQL